ncbi:hypothetical protein ACFRI7_37525 [Streptomyces sp. NPDC056716]|uniref:hypothetical protein n=1 Tax=unclassified Streptomyces TaxID=2593676 RepID=UPI0036B474D3
MGTPELTLLNDAFKHRLTYPRSRGRRGATEVAEGPYGTPPALRDVDAEQVARVAHELTQGIAIGAIGGMPLRTLFAGSIAALYGDRHNAAQWAVAEFLRTGHRTGVDMLGLRAGVSVIEGFGRFLLERGEQVALVQGELLAGLLKTLARHPEPGFLVGHPFVWRTGPGAWAGYTSAEGLLASPDVPPGRAIAHVACRGRYFSGALGATLLSGLLADVSPRPAWVSAQPDATSALRGKGLLP